MRILILFILLLKVWSCSGGVEGFVNEPITIIAPEPEDKEDFDYFWSLEQQPDGSLINSQDLVTSENEKKMIFKTYYTGDNYIELKI